VEKIPIAPIVEAKFIGFVIEVSDEAIRTHPVKDGSEEPFYDMLRDLVGDHDQNKVVMPRMVVISEKIHSVQRDMFDDRQDAFYHWSICRGPEVSSHLQGNQILIKKDWLEKIR